MNRALFDLGQALSVDNANPTNQNTLLGTVIKSLVENLAQTEVVFTDDVPAYYVVTSTGVAASSNDVTHIGRVVGIITENAQAGKSQIVIVSGMIINPTWSFIPGSPVYLNGNTLSNTAPSSGFVQRIGVATSANTLIVQLGPSIRKA